MASLILEPCCFHKQLANWFPRNTSTMVHLYTYGDVILPNLLPWLVRRTDSHSGVHVTLALPSVTGELLDALQGLRDTRLTSQTGESYPLLADLDIITRDVMPLHPYASLVTRAAASRNLSFMAVTLESAVEHVTLLGNLVQQIIPGPHLLSLSSQPETFSAIQPFLSSQLRTHSVIL